MLLAAPIVVLAAGVGLLGRQKWARLVYAVWVAISLVVRFAMPHSLASGGVAVVLAITSHRILFSPSANAWFAD